jgi:FkbM family methyltransferase
MTALARIQENIRDVGTFGPSFLKRHLARLTGSPSTSVSVRPVGNIHVRVGESDIAAVRQVFRDGGYGVDFKSPTGARILQRYNDILTSGKAPVIVDAGANIGAATLLLCAQFPKASVVSIEPDPGNFSMLERNAKGHSQVYLMQAAIGSTGGYASIKNEGMGWAVQTERATSGVPIITMKDAFDAIVNGVPFIAKIDIEGFEADLFSANLDWLDETFVVYIEPHDWMLPGQYTSRTFQRAMGQRDYEIFLSGETLTYVRSV